MGAYRQSIVQVYEPKYTVLSKMSQRQRGNHSQELETVSSGFPTITIRQKIIRSVINY